MRAPDLERDRPIIALLEARMQGELARLVERHGGDPLNVPLLREVPQVLTPEITRLFDEIESGRHEIAIFLTGVAVSLLFELAEQAGRRAALVESLGRITTVSRGPKPTAALRGFGVPSTLTAREPFTSAELLDALGAVDVAGRRVLLLNYGDRSETLAETLRARRAELREVCLYRWQEPEDPRLAERLVRRIIAREVDALVVTCQVQFRHLCMAAERIRLDRELLHALTDHVVVAAVGPTCRAMLEAPGVPPHVVPAHPKMGPLVGALMRHIDDHGLPSTARARPGFSN
jgi:uroporphyrinogen-III synthase